jgi:hypothetical protein
MGENMKTMHLIRSKIYKEFIKLNRKKNLFFK